MIFSTIRDYFVEKRDNLQEYINEQGHFHAASDGSRLFFQRWLPRSWAKDSKSNKKKAAYRLFIIQHGFGEHGGRYGNLVSALRGTKTIIYALDCRGHGRSEGKRGHVDQFQHYIDDLADLIKIAKKEQSQEDFFLLGHSLGGVIALQYALQQDNQEALRALILSSPAVRINMNLKQHSKKLFAKLFASITPDKTIKANLDLAFLSHDPQVLEAYKNDPLVHDMVSFQMGVNLFSLGKALIQKSEKIQIPTYILCGSEDKIADPEGARNIHQNLSCQDKELRVYPGLYHEPINELQQQRDIVLRDLVTWYMRH